MGRPLTTLRRYSGICSTVSGVPWARRRTACLGIRRLQAELANHFCDSLHVFNRRVGDDTVTKVEDVSGSAVGAAQDFLDAEFEEFNGSEECDGVEVALDGVSVAHGAPAFVEGLPPVEADH